MGVDASHTRKGGCYETDSPRSVGIRDCECGSANIGKRAVLKLARLASVSAGPCWDGRYYHPYHDYAYADESRDPQRIVAPSSSVIFRSRRVCDWRRPVDEVKPGAGPRPPPI
jgi:hypothetical protein